MLCVPEWLCYVFASNCRVRSWSAAQCRCARQLELRNLEGHTVTEEFMQDMHDMTDNS